MTAQTKASLKTEINTNFADNTSGAITPALLRTTVTDCVDSWQQYAAVNAQTGTSYTFLVADYGQLVTFNNASSIAVTLPQGTGSFAQFSVFVKNLGAGVVTITPTTSTINGAVTLTLNQNQSYFIVSDGANYQIFGMAIPVVIGQGGTGQVTAAAARASSGLNIDAMTKNGDSSYSVVATDRVVATSAAFTTSRTWTLPAANAINAGQQIAIVDLAGGVTGTNTLVIARAGADTINGGTSVTINAANGGYLLISDGVSKWSAQGVGSTAVAGVSSFAGRTGAVVTANDDYTVTQLTAIAAATVVANNTGGSARPAAVAASTVGSSLVLIQTQTAAAASSVDFTTGIDSTYNEYLFIFTGILPGTDAQNLYTRISTDAGATWKAGGTDYKRAINQLSDAGTNTVTAATAEAQITTTVSQSSNVGRPMGGEMRLFNPSAATLNPITWMMGYFDGTNYKMLTGGGQYTTGTAINGVRFLFASGTITGTIALYGVRKS